MTYIQPKVVINDTIVPLETATQSVASAAVLYGLSVYTVAHAHHSPQGWLLFRLKEHIARLRQSAAMIGFSVPETLTTEATIRKQISRLLKENNPEEDQFVRITVHADALLPGIKTSGLSHSLSIFSYDAERILPSNGARIKTSLWRRTADTAIPARAKVNGAYVNSALAKQDAIDSGCDDCLFLNGNGYVSELSAANVWMVKGKTLITPDTASDILEGITRRSIIELAESEGYTVIERPIALTELYTADEVFACGTSAFVSPILEIDKRTIGTGQTGTQTAKLRELLREKQSTENVWTDNLGV